MGEFDIWRGLAVGLVIFVGYTYPKTRLALLVMSIGVGIWVYIDQYFLSAP